MSASIINKIRNFRTYLLKQIQTLSVEQLNAIPPGYNNNIIWNLGHMNAALQNMCYVKANQPVTVRDEYFTPYLSGTKPEKMVDHSQVDVIKTLFVSSIDQLEVDLRRNLFTNYSPSAAIHKVYGFEVRNIEEALEYLLYHEGYHSGCIASLQKLVVNDKT